MRKILFVACVLFSACSSRHVTATVSSDDKAISIYGKLFATMYQQKAAEYKALCLQAYNIAQFRLDQYQPQTNKPKAIVTDIDETILNNSPYEAHQTLQGKDYDQDAWYQWTDQSAADTLPGAAAFLKYAASKGVEIFYVTNREERERGSTIRNLSRFNLPNADDAHFLPRQTVSSKEARREMVASTHEIIMFIGDNLADLSSLFDKKTMAERSQNAGILSKDFGNRFIVLPNTVYGDWEGALFNYNRKLTQAQKDSVIRAEVKGY